MQEKGIKSDPIDPSSHELDPREVTFDAFQYAWDPYLDCVFMKAIHAPNCPAPDCFEVRLLNMVSELATNTLEHECFFFRGKGICADVVEQERDFPFESLADDLSDLDDGRDSS
jgi:hypothetical protein